MAVLVRRSVPAFPNTTDMTTVPTEINAAAARATSEKVTPMMAQYLGLIFQSSI